MADPVFSGGGGGVVDLGEGGGLDKIPDHAT